MKKNYLHIIIGLSVLVLAGSVLIADYGISRTVASMTTILEAGNIAKDPEYFKIEIQSLEKRNQAIESRLNRLKNLKEPNLDILNKVSYENNVKITGINRKRSLLNKDKSGSQIELIFTGRITNVLNCLNYIENNFILKMERLWMQRNSEDENYVDLYLLIVLPEEHIDDI